MTKMNPESQSIAIAKACGWKFLAGTALCYWVTPTGNAVMEPPDYLNDLNAMHEAEKTLTKEQRQFHNAVLMKASLASNGDPFNAISANAECRAESFLRTIGKWEDGE